MALLDKVKSSIIRFMSIKAQIEILRKAQELDREIYQLAADMENLPEEKKSIQQEFESEKKSLNDAEQNLKKIQLGQKEKEGQLAQREAHILKLEGQLSQVKTNKEYTALQHEIATAKADNSILEEAILKFFDDIETAQKKIAEEKDRLKEKEKEFSARISSIDDKVKKANSEFESKKKTREEIIAQTAPEVRDLYSRVVQKKQGVALAPVRGEICGSCRIQLRAQVMNEVMLGQELVQCENCSRILYYE